MIIKDVKIFSTNVDTHALPGVALSEFKLRLFGVLLALILNRALDDRLIDFPLYSRKILVPKYLPYPNTPFPRSAEISLSAPDSLHSSMWLPPVPSHTSVE